MSWDNSGSNNLSSWDLFETRRLDYAKGKKGGPRNATHCCFVTCVRGSELFVIATRVLVEILDAVSDALLDEAWTTHSGGGDVAATCDLGCWDQRHHPIAMLFCGQHHACCLARSQQANGPGQRRRQHKLSLPRRFSAAQEALFVKLAGSCMQAMVLQSVSYVGLDQAVTQRRDCPFLNKPAFPWGFCVLPRLSFSNRPANHR